MGRAPCCDKGSVKKGPWSPEEDRKLKDYIHKNGTGGNWIALPTKAGLKRCGKSCRLRWLNYLRPNIKHGDFSADEDMIICNLFAAIGSRWSVIAAQLPGRTDNDIKNYWNTKLKKKLLTIMPLPPTTQAAAAADADPPPPLLPPQYNSSTTSSYGASGGLLMFGGDHQYHQQQDNNDGGLYFELCNNNSSIGLESFIMGGGLQLQLQQEDTMTITSLQAKHNMTSTAAAGLLDHHPQYESSSNENNAAAASCYEPPQMKPFLMVAPTSGFFYGAGEAAGASQGRFLY